MRSRLWFLLLGFAWTLTPACSSEGDAVTSDEDALDPPGSSPEPSAGKAGAGPAGSGGVGGTGGAASGGTAGQSSGGTAGQSSGGAGAGGAAGTGGVGGAGNGSAGAGAGSGSGAGAGNSGAGAAGASGGAGQGGSAGAGGQACVPGAAACASASKVEVCNEAGTGTASTLDCPAGTVCDQGGCVGSLSWHLARSVDLQYVHEYPAAQLLSCGADAAADLAAGRIGCDARRSTAQIEGRFGLFLGNTWLTFPGGPAACAASPDVASWRGCVADNLKLTIARFHAQAPNLLAASHLAEFIHKNNAPQSWPSLCVPGSLGVWGPDTCIPDVASSAAARQYLIDWGKAHIDAGIRAFVFGQARLLGGFSPGSNDVSPGGAAGLKQIIDALRAHAQLRGAPHVYFGAQATSSVAVGGVEQIDFLMGAQHLEPSKGMLLQPLLPKGPFLGASHYGPEDWHDANISTNHRRLPVLLDYDNWSSDPSIPDDIRYLAQVSGNAERGRVLLDHARHLHLYDPLAWLSIPVSKTLGNAQGTTCTGINAWHFSASACGLVGPAKQALDQIEATPTVDSSDSNPPIRTGYWGQQLRGRDATISWLFRVFLGRTPDPAGYAFHTSSLPALIDEPCGARATLAKNLIASAEFEAKGTTNEAFVDMVYRAFVLREPDASGRAWWASQLGSMSRSQLIDAFCSSGEGNALYAP